jgi:hypothetical protein
MDNRTFWLGLLGGLVGGAIIIGAGYLALKAFLPAPQDDPLYKMKRVFLHSGTVMSRAGTWDEILYLSREREQPVEIPSFQTS